MGDPMVQKEPQKELASLPDYSEWLLYLNSRDRGGSPKETTTPPNSTSPFDIGKDQPGHTYTGALQGAAGTGAQKQAIEFGEMTGKKMADAVFPGGSMAVGKAIEKSRQVMPDQWKASLNTQTPQSATPPEKPGFVKSVLGTFVDLAGMAAGKAMPGAGAGLSMAIGIPAGALKERFGLGNLKQWATSKLNDMTLEKEKSFGPSENFSGRAFGEVDREVTGPGRKY